MSITNEQLAANLSALFSPAFCAEAVFSTVSAEQLAAANRVTLAGDGVGHCAALVCEPLFERIEKEAGAAFAIRTETAGGTEFARYFDEHRRFWLEDKNAGLNRINPLLCFVDVQGNLPDEALRKGMAYMSVPVAFCDDPESPFFNTAPHRFPLLKSECPAASYTAAAASLARFALAFQVAAGRMKEEAAKAQWQGAAQHAAAFDAGRIADLRRTAEALAAEWKARGVDWVDCVADGPAAGLAQLGRILFARKGISGEHMGCAEWETARAACTNPAKTAVLFYADADSPAFGRTLSSIEKAAAAGFAVAVAGDIPPHRLPDGVTLFSLPAAPTRWSAPILGCVPFALAANTL